MKTTKLTEIPIVPESFANSQYANIDWHNIYSEMHDNERRFINGLIAYYEPKKLLEVGVCAGAGTVNMLNAIGAYDYGAELISIDHATSGDYGYDPEVSSDFMRNMQVGYEVERLAEKMQTDNWRLITGKDPAEVMEEIGGNIEFAVIDTAHYQPVELLNFLCVLPFLSDGAIVIIHDVMGINVATPSGFFAPRILMSCLSCEKLTLADDSKDNFKANIVAIQISSDTRKYIRNVFEALFIPWGKIPPTIDLNNVGALITRYYTPGLVRLYGKAVRNSIDLCVSGKLEFTSAQMRKSKLQNMLKDNEAQPIVFYGAGAMMREFIKAISNSDLLRNCTIWDESADNIGQIYGNPVTLPDFSTRVNDRIAIVMISNLSIADEVASKLRGLGYEVYHGIKDYLIRGE
jgi:predicted O-methyltransferase YrrM